MEGMQTFASLKFFNFRLWLAGGLVSNIGTWMQRVAQDWLVLTALTHESGTAVGIVTGLQFLPFLLLSPYAGVIVDRFDARKLLMVTQTAAGTLGVGLGTLVLTDTVQLWHVYVFAFLLGVVSAFDNPARQTFVTQLVAAPNLPNAVGLNSASFNAARLIGPGIAGVLIAAVGTGWVFMINGLTFAATIAALLFMRLNELIPHERVARRKGQVREGVRYVRRRADIVVIMIIVAVVSSRHPLARRKAVELAELADEPFLFLKRQSEPQIYEHFLGHCARAGFQPRVVMEVEHSEALLSFIAAGIGVSCVPSLVEKLRVKGVVTLPLRPEIRGGISAVWNPQRLTPPAARFLEALRSELVPAQRS